ncbi:unnamed protein product [Closterium sp. NIES-65]|nr:unnamed protein product [Closterium sp. NIES-65]
MAQLTQDQQQRLELLELEEKRLQNAVRHLIRSNEELQAADVAEPDPVYREALMENQVVVQSLREKIALLQAEIAEMKGRDSGMEERGGEVGRGDCEGEDGEVQGGAAGAADSAAPPATSALEQNPPHARQPCPPDPPESQASHEQATQNSPSGQVKKM